MLVNPAWLDAWPSSSYLLCAEYIGPFTAYSCGMTEKKLKGNLTTNVMKAKAFLDKAQALFTNSREDIFLNLPYRSLDLEFLRPELKHTITPAEASLLTAHVTRSEVKEAFFDIDVESAPGPDGYTSEFYRAACDYKDHCEAYTSDSAIDDRQLANAFVPGRSITDNILLAQELLAGYNQMRLPNRCTLKVDIQKAYDSVEWDFLLEVLRTENKSSKEPDYFIPISAAGTATDTGLSGVSRRHFAYQIPSSSSQSLAAHVLGIGIHFTQRHPANSREEDEKIPLAWKWKREGSMGQICKPKQEGGLGIRSLMITNQALMLKQLWRLIQNDGTSIWVEWIQRHRLRQSTIWTFNGATGSWGWKNCSNCDLFLQRGVIYKVGDGSSFSLWQDVWHDEVRFA
ncbi:UNVERIFIED_CONTAM: hypothetical protein Scaly_3028200 [Sesamum calycinum]|uniref:Reverse transcriptase domain-containing protein n=1 Tax=Sesamum calycinum TaxID=2727403 RepID=A0AAW2K6Q3_9LAMI